MAIAYSARGASGFGAAVALPLLALVLPLKLLVPFVIRYRGRAAAAVVALLVASLATLAVPIAVRRMIDFGFSPEGIAMINSYFSVMIGVVAILAGASAARFYQIGRASCRERV